MRTAILTALTTMCVSFAGAAHASLCGGTADLYADLTVDYAEKPIWLGIAGTGAIVEVWGNADTQTWTIFISEGGISCVMATGTGFASILIGQPL